MSTQNKQIIVMYIKHSVKFYLNSRFCNKEKYKIYGRIIHNRKKSEFATNLWLEPEKWNQELQVAIKSPVVNRQLGKIISDINETIQHLYYEKKHIDAKSIKDYYVGNEVLDIGVIDYISRIINQKRKDKSLSRTTPQKYEVLSKKISKFLLENYKVRDINIKRVDYQFVINFDTYLRSLVSEQYNKPLANSTINKTHGFFRTIINQALEEDYIKRNPYKRFKLKKTEGKVQYLNKYELSRIENLDLSSTPHLDLARDIFIFSVYTGLRFGDATSLKTKNLIYENGDLKYFYKSRQEKTGNPVENPLFPQVKAIIRKYEDTPERQVENLILPKLSNDKVNKHLKIIGKLADVKSELHHHIARHTCATTVLLENDVNLEEVKEWLGHVDIRSTMVYAKVTSSKKMKTLERLVA